MAGKKGLWARILGVYRTAYRVHYIPYLHFFYGGEYLHHGGEPVQKLTDLPYVRVPEPREKAP